jgi:HemY protein
LWKRIPGRFQENEEILLAYVKRRIQTEDTDQLEPLIRSVLKRHRNDALIYYYGVVSSADSRRHLAMAESLLVGHETDAVTLLTVGRLSLRNQLWGKARSYLEASLHSRPDAQVYHELGNLLDSLGEHELAAKCFRDGLRLSPGCEFSVPLKKDLKMETVAVAPMDLPRFDVTHDHLLAGDDLAAEDVDDHKKADLKKVLT